MEKYIIYLVILLCCSEQALSQNNGIFNGGSNDGHAKTCYQQGSNLNYTLSAGGNGDGYSKDCYSQTSNLNLTLSAGGSGDGAAKDCFTQVSNLNPIFNGGSGGDGMLASCASEPLGCYFSVDLGNDTTICNGNTVMLNAGSFPGGASYVWQDNSTNQTFAVTSSGQYIVQITDTAGCTGIDTINVFVAPTSFKNLNIAICESYVVPSGDETYTSSGVYMDTIPNATGCDSILTINLTILNPTFSAQSVTACDSYTVPSSDETYTSSGVYMDTIPNTTGCDSILTINLTINTSTVGSESITTCDNYIWPANGLTYTSSGTYVATLTNAAGCDSTATLNLIITNSSTSSQAITACDSFTVPSGDETYTSSGIYTDTIPNAAGCDSIITISLTLNNSNSGSENIIACNSYTWPANGMTYTSSGTYVTTLTNATGCDSVSTLNLTINSSSSASQTLTVCDGFTVPSGDETYTASGVYIDTIPNVLGCDSIITYDLTVNYSTSSTTVISSCDSYLWSANGTTYTSSGVFNTVLTNAAGCDSLLTLDLTINGSTTSSQNITECDSYTVPSGDETYTSSGIYMDTIPNATGCDSVITVNLTIGYSNSGSESVTACNNYTWSANGTTYTSSGTYVATLTNAAGCDSTATLSLTINTVDSGVSLAGTTLTANASNATYQWVDCDNDYTPLLNETNQSFTAIQNGNYAVIITENGCEDTSSCTLIDFIGLEEHHFGSNFNAYPNPTNGTITIELGETYEQIHTKVFNITGQLLKQFSSTNTDSLHFELHGVAGYYLIEVESSQGKSVKLGIVKK